MALLIFPFNGFLLTEYALRDKINSYNYIIEYYARAREKKVDFMRRLWYSTYATQFNSPYYGVLFANKYFTLSHSMGIVSQRCGVYFWVRSVSERTFFIA